METGRTIRTLWHLLISVVWVSEIVVEVVRFWIFLKVDLTGFATCSCSRESTGSGKGAEIALFKPVYLFPRRGENYLGSVMFYLNFHGFRVIVDLL